MAVVCWADDKAARAHSKIHARDFSFDYVQENK